MVNKVNNEILTFKVSSLFRPKYAIPGSYRSRAAASAVLTGRSYVSFWLCLCISWMPSAVRPTQYWPFSFLELPRPRSVMVTSHIRSVLWRGAELVGGK